MPFRKEQIFEPDRPYHVLARAVEGKEIFGTREDCARFIFQMYAANIGSPALNLHRANIQKAAEALLTKREIPEALIRPAHPPIVEFFSFALVNDHYHFGLVPTVPNGISRYLQKLNVAFAKYYNLKYNRRGALFEGRFKAVPVRTPAQLDALVKHINVKNIVDIHQPNWVDEGLQDHDSAIRFVKEYPYSSFPDLFLGRRSLIVSDGSRSELKKFFPGNFTENKEDYLQTFKHYLEKQSTPFEHVFLE